MKKHRKIRAFLFSAAVVMVLTVVVVLGIDLLVRISVGEQIITKEEATQFENADCILVLGAFVKPDGSPSRMLKDRLDCAIELYQNGAAKKLLMSGDHGTMEYDEVNEMKQYAIEAGVASEDIFMDHAGFSTYESMYRAKEIFGADKIIVVTQRYHLYRALYDADKLGLKAVGVCAKEVNYSGQTYRGLREIAARNKDFIYTILKVKPTYLGEPISLNQSGDITNDME